jgi:hypothetical protein
MNNLEILQIISAFVSMYAIGVNWKYAFILVLLSGAVSITRYIRNSDIASVAVQLGVVVFYLVGLIIKNI